MQKINTTPHNLNVLKTLISYATDSNGENTHLSGKCIVYRGEKLEIVASPDSVDIVLVEQIEPDTFGENWDFDSDTTHMLFFLEEVLNDVLTHGPGDYTNR